MSEPKCICGMGGLNPAVCSAHGYTYPPQQDPVEVIKQERDYYIGNAVYLAKTLDRVTNELADLRQVAQGLREENEKLKTISAYKALADLDAKTLRELSHRQEDKITTLQEQITKHDYIIGEWQGEELLWKEREMDLLAKLSVASAGLTDIRGLHYNCQECALTSGDEQCVTYQIAKQALAQIEGTDLNDKGEK